MGDLSYDNFYPRSPCGERLLYPFSMYQYIAISIHALLAESDAYSRKWSAKSQLFLSTLSLRRATGGGAQCLMSISFLSTLSLRRATCFFCVKLLLQLIFLSTLSLRRATRCQASDISAKRISIHALLAESDLMTSSLVLMSC